MTTSYRRINLLISSGVLILALGGCGSTQEKPDAKKKSTGKSETFSITGSLGSKLYPGAKVPLNLTIKNSNKFKIKLIGITVSLKGTNSPSCSLSNFKVQQFSGKYPLRVAPGNWRLSDHVTSSTKWPQVIMLNLSTNQDVCKNVEINFGYKGTAKR